MKPVWTPIGQRLDKTIKEYKAKQQLMWQPPVQPQSVHPQVTIGPASKEHLELKPKETRPLEGAYKKNGKWVEYGSKETNRFFPSSIAATPEWLNQQFTGGLPWERGGGENFVGNWVAPGMIPGGLMREPFALVGKVLPPALTKSGVGRLTSRILDVAVGKSAEIRPPVVRGAENLAQSELATSEVGGIGKNLPKNGKIIPKVETLTPKVEQSLSESEQFQKKVFDLIDYQKKISRATTTMQAEARAPRFQEIGKLRQKPQGEVSYQKIGEALKGKLPYATGKGELPISLSQKEIDYGYNAILASELKDSEVYAAQTAWQRLIEPKKYAILHPDLAETVPANKGLRPFEVKMFETAFGKDFATKLAADSPALRAAMKVNDIFFELYYNGLLGGKSNIRNFTFNSIRSMFTPIEKAFTTTADVALSGFGKIRPREQFYGEIPEQMIGTLGALRDGTRDALRIIKTGQRFGEPGHEMTETIIKGKLGRAINLPSTFMDAGDALFFEPAKQGSLNELAFREAKKLGLKGDALIEKYAELKANPPPEMMGKAIDAALDLLFRGKSDFASTLIRFREHRIGGFTPARIILPFIKVPINVTKYGLARSPIAALNPKMYMNIARKDPKAAEQLGRLMMGSAISASLAMYSWQGKITGQAPTSVTERNTFYDIEGKQPYSIRIGNEWINYQQIPVLSTILSQIAATVDAIKTNDKGAGQRAAKAVYAITQSVTDQPYLTGLSDTIDALTDPERSADNFINKTIPSLMPASGTTRLAAQAIDPTIRQPGNPAEGIMANIPGLSQQVPPKLTAFGEEIQRQTPVYLPMNISSAKDTVLGRELTRLGINPGFVGDTINNIPLTREQKQEYQIIVGQLVKQRLESIVMSKDYQLLKDDKLKMKVLDGVISRAREQGKFQMLSKLPQSNPTTSTTSTSLQDRAKEYGVWMK